MGQGSKEQRPNAEAGKTTGRQEFSTWSGCFGRQMYQYRKSRYPLAPFLSPSSLLTMTSHGMGDPLGQSSPAVPSLCPREHLPTPSPWFGGLQRRLMRGQPCSGTAKALGWDQPRCSHECQAQQHRGCSGQRELHPSHTQAKGAQGALPTSVIPRFNESFPCRALWRHN